VGALLAPARLVPMLGGLRQSKNTWLNIKFMNQELWMTLLRVAAVVWFLVAIRMIYKVFATGGRDPEEPTQDLK